MPETTTTIEGDAVSTIEAPVQPVTVKEVLHRAADLLGEWGWCQGGARVGDSFCALGAIWFAATGSPPTDALIDDDTVEDTHVYFIARARFASVARGAGFWNDEEGRTKTEVIARLREAAALS